MTSKHVLAVVAFFALMGSAAAREVEMPVAMSKADFDVTKAHLIAQLDTDRYSEISPQQKRKVIDALDRIDARLGSPAGSDKINDDDRVAIFNDQELVNTIMSRAVEDSRMYCEREAPLGTHRIRTVCLTMATWMERERSGQTAMHTVQTHQNESFSGAE